MERIVKGCLIIVAVGLSTWGYIGIIITLFKFFLSPEYSKDAWAALSPLLSDLVTYIVVLVIGTTLASLIHKYSKERIIQELYPSPIPPPPPQLQYCPHCGQMIQLDWRVCPYCGSKLK